MGDPLAEDCRSCDQSAGRYNVCWYCEVPTCTDCVSEARAWNGDSHEQVGLCPKCMDEDVPAKIDWLGIQTFAPPQPATGYQKNVTPRGPVLRPEDAFPTACCEGAALNDGRDAE